MLISLPSPPINVSIIIQVICKVVVIAVPVVPIIPVIPVIIVDVPVAWVVIPEVIIIPVWI